MGAVEAKTKKYYEENNEKPPINCTYCNCKFEAKDNIYEYFPHEAGGYCIFAPRSTIDYACTTCAHKSCTNCSNTQLPRYAFIDCTKCNKTHCFNNTDMKDIALQQMNLCKTTCGSKS